MGHYYIENIDSDSITLSPEESKHIVRVMRKKVGDELQFTDGKGGRIRARISVAEKELCIAEVFERETCAKRPIGLHVAVAPTKNPDRMEWFVEKAVEVGVEKITFLQCEHSERKRIDLARIHRIAIAALKQSSALFLPELAFQTFDELLSCFDKNQTNGFIAYCEDDAQSSQFVKTQYLADEVLLIIGPEGDFSVDEVRKAKNVGIQPVKLGNKILRTETAALYGVCAFAMRELN